MEEKIGKMIKINGTMQNQKNDCDRRRMDLNTATCWILSKYTDGIKGQDAIDGLDKLCTHNFTQR